MSGLFGGLAALAIGAAYWWWRREGMRKRLAEFDAGTRCIACHGTHLTVADGKARCNTCFHTADLAAMRAAVVTEQQISDATRPQ